MERQETGHNTSTTVLTMEGNALAAHILLLIFRTVLMYGITFVTMRIMGKREIGKLSIFDLVISIMIAEIAVIVLEDIKKPLYDGIIPIVVLAAIQVGIAFISLKSRKIRLLADGRPSIIVSKGKLHRKEMSKLRYNLDDLMQQMRGKNVDSLADVEFAILETSGQLTIIPKDSSGDSSTGGSETSGNSDDGAGSSQNGNNSPDHLVEIPYKKITYEGLPLPLILDGNAVEENLELIEKDRAWLEDEMQHYGAQTIEDVFLCSIDHKGKIYVDLKESD